MNLAAPCAAVAMLLAAAAARGKRLSKVARLGQNPRNMLRESIPDTPPYPETAYPIWPPFTNVAGMGRKIVKEEPGKLIPYSARRSRLSVEPGIGFWAQKVGSQLFFEWDAGQWWTYPGTVLAVKRGGNYVVQKHWPEKHGYYGIGVGYDRLSLDDCNPLWKGVFSAAELPPMRRMKNTMMIAKDWGKYEVGQKIVVSDNFKVGDSIQVVGRQKIRGHLSAIKRMRHKRGPMTHGSKNHRHFGSLGAAKTPARCIPGKRKWGVTGGRQVTLKKVRIVRMEDQIDEMGMPETIIFVKGRIPGQALYRDNKLGADVFITHSGNPSDGRNRRDPIYMWYGNARDPNRDPFLPATRDVPGKKVNAKKTTWGQDTRWIAHEVKKWWPEGYPGYDHSADPFQDDCDPRLAMKVRDPYRTGPLADGYPSMPKGTVAPRYLRYKTSGFPRPKRGCQGKPAKAKGGK